MKTRNPAIVVAEDRANLAESALRLVCTSMPDATERLSIREPGNEFSYRYTLKLYGRNRPHGGILIVTFEYAGQAPTVDSHYFETYTTNWRRRLGTSPESVAFCTACEALSRKADTRNAA